MCPARALQQRIILHVARADLDDVSVLLHQFERFVIDGLGNDQQTKAVADFRQDLQALLSQTLKCVGRGARLVGASAEEAGAGAGHALGGSERLITGFDSACLLYTSPSPR